MNTLEDLFEACLSACYEAAHGNRPSTKWLSALAQWAGTRGDPMTIDDAGRIAGVSPQQFARVVREIMPYLKGVWVPPLGEVTRKLTENSPISDPIGRVLAKSGHSRKTLTAAGLLHMFKLVGTTPRSAGGADLVLVGDSVIAKSESLIGIPLATAKKHTSSFGMTTVEELRQAMSTHGERLSSAEIDRILKADPSVRWAGPWLWVDKADNLQANRLINTARSILSVNSPQSVRSIHEGARRVWRSRNLDVLPGVAPMVEFFKQTPHFIVEGDSVRTSHPIDYHDLMGNAACDFIDVLKSSPHQIMDRQSLNDAREEAGIALGTFGAWMSYAEWMDRFAPSVWGLRGCNPHPAAVKAVGVRARSRSNSENHRKSWAWAPDGTAVLTVDVTTSLLSGGVLSLGPSLHSFLAGRSLTVAADGRPLGIAKVGAEHGFCWGWCPALTSLGARRGDVLRVRINMGTHAADVSIGGEELWG